MNTPESQILTLLSRRDGATIPQIADALGISIGTATKYVGLLLEENALEDCGKTESVTGRRPHRYSLRANTGWFLGLEVNDRYVNVGLMDFQGNLREKRIVEGFSLESILNGIGKFITGLGERVVNGGVFSYESPENEIEITLPSTCAVRVEAATSNARVLAENLTFVQPLRLTTSNAYIQLEDVNCAQDITLTTSNSRIVLNDVNVNGAHLATSNGRILLDDMIVREDLVAVNSNGGIKIADCQIGGALAASTSNGAIELDETACPDVTLKTSNGAIGGILKGAREEYTVISGTSNANNQLGNFGSGEKKLRAMTSNAPITLRFEE